VRRMRWFLGAAVLHCLCACARICLGAPDATPNGRRVELTIGAKANEMEPLEPSIRELLVAKGLDVATARKLVVTAQDVAAAIAPPNEAMLNLARVLLDFTVTGQATLFLVDPRRGRVYVRRMALPHGLDAVARASVRFVVEQSIDAILEGREIGVSRDEFQRGVPPPPPLPPSPDEARSPGAPAPVPSAAPDPTRSQLLVAAGYEAVAMRSGDFQHAAKVAIGARVARLVIAAAARLAAPITIVGGGVHAQLSTAGVSVAGAGRLLNRGGFSVLAGLGAGLDFTRVAPVVQTSDLQPATAFWALGPSMRPFVAIERFVGRISIAVAVGAEVHLLDERYTVRTSTETREVFVPGRVRPAADMLVGVAF
jgi:hypothetical protein